MKLTESQLRKIIKEELATTIKSERINEGLIAQAIMGLLRLIAPDVAAKLFMYGIIGMNKEDPSKAEMIVAKMDKELKIKVYMMALNTPILPAADRNLVTRLIMTVGAEQPQLPDASAGGQPPVQESKRRR